MLYNKFLRSPWQKPWCNMMTATMEKGGGRKKIALFCGDPLGNPAPNRKSEYDTVSSCSIFRYWLPGYERVIALLSLEEKVFQTKKKKKKEKKVKRKKILRAKLVKLRPPRGKKLKIMALFPGEIVALRIYIECRPKATIIRPGSSLGKGRICWDTRGVYCCLVVCFRSIHTQ